jgi:hypothetical protein
MVIDIHADRIPLGERPPIYFRKQRAPLVHAIQLKAVSESDDHDSPTAERRQNLATACFPAA